MNKIVSFFNVIAKLKDVNRTGWVKRGISQPESVADHTLAMVMTVAMFCPAHLNKEKCLLLALFHDLHEALTGDIVAVYAGDAEKAEKYKLELAAITQISVEFEAPWLLDLFNEFEAGKTPEAQFVGSIDKLEACLQAKYYAELGRMPYSVFEEFKKNALVNVRLTDEFVRKELEALS